MTDSALRVLAAEAADCRACDLWRDATQTVFGDGPAAAKLVLIGEQPGDEEDLAGQPFVGPAGRLLDKALGEAGLDRGAVYVTNAVKHFKWSARGKRRIHERPSRGEVVACHQWLERELDVFEPDAVLVTLGATAGQSVFGPKFRVGAARGEVLTLDTHPVVATIHPSAVLRARTPDDRASTYADLVADLERAAGLIG
jgi:DNA polymerase